ncbi:MAG: tetratricopeptide repeat protein [Gemmataceae bacterium]|nr:tetratricopeptide repeat protein [Gemmataceae bacterium]MDW8266206.1 tetratricopeptide repeat protein [Gemmataceae bacterium]
MVGNAELFVEAVQRHRAGDLAAAEALYRQILQAEPQHAQAMQLLGLIAHQVGQHEQAIRLIEDARRLAPTDAVILNNLGLPYQSLDRLDEAEACFREALRWDPDYVEAHNNLGLVLRKKGRTQEAETAFREAIRRRPDCAAAHNNLGAILRDLKRPEEAEACLRHALALRPDYAEAHVNLGNLHRDAGRWRDAEACYRRALQLQPNHAEACNNLGTVLRDLGRPGEAIDFCRRALALRPNNPEACNNLGNALSDLHQLEEAAHWYLQSIRLKPDHAEAYLNLAAARWRQGRMDEAEAAYQEVLRLDPESSSGYNNYGVLLCSVGRVDEALAAHRRALELKPDHALAHSNLVYTEQFRSGVTLARLAEVHAEWERRHAAPLRRLWRPMERHRDPERRLRLGLVSSNFCRHPVSYFLVRTLEALDRQQFEVFCYSDRVTRDDYTERVAACADRWHDTRGLTDAELADLVRAEQIDLFVDLSGHTEGNRLLAFARRPAPIQLTWIGYQGSTGLTAIDYLIADRYVLPEGAEVYCSEKVLRLPDAFFCYDPPPAAPPVGPLPARRPGAVTFGCFNSPAKITTDILAVWSDILRRLPQARLVLKFRGLDSTGPRQRLLDLLAKAGADLARVELRGYSPQPELLASYAEIDLALDPYPFTGSTTTCEALWMGVPVLTCPGETFASRCSFSYLSNVGLTETIAGSLEEYADLAVRWANDLDRLRELRATLRERMAQSPMCDGPRFAANLAEALRRVWRHWCEAGDPR